MILVSIVFVLAAAATLAAGLLNAGLGLIYASIACSLAAALFLVVAVLRGRPDSSAPAASSPRPFSSAPEPAPAVGGSWVEPVAAKSTSTVSPRSADWKPPSVAPAVTVTPTAAPAPAAPQAGVALLSRLRRRGSTTTVAETEGSEPDGDTTGGEGAGLDAGETTAPAADDRTAAFARPRLGGGEPAGREVGASDDEFPIPGYDELRATSIVTRLDGLDRRQLDQIRAREVAGKNRFSVMSRVDARLAALGPAEESADVSVAAAVVGKVGRSTGRAPGRKGAAKKATVSRPPAKKASATKAPAAKAPAAKALVPTALAGVAAATTAVAATKAVTSRKAAARKQPAARKATTARKSALPSTTGSPPSAAQPAKAAAEVQAAPTKAAPVRKSAAASKAASVKRVAATKAPATKAPATKAPATKAPATKAPVKRVAATKAPAVKAPAAKAVTKATQARKAVKKG